MVRTDFRSTHDSWRPRRCGFFSTRGSLRSISSKASLLRNSAVFRGDEGSSLVEMAIATTVLFALLFGVFEISLASYTYHYISDAAREGARWAMVRGSLCSLDMPWAPSSFQCDATADQIEAYVKSLGYPGIDSRKMTVSTIWLKATSNPVASSSSTTWATTACGTTDSCKYAGNQVQVKVSYDFPLSIPFWNTVTIPISSTSTMVISQ